MSKNLTIEEYFAKKSHSPCSAISTHQKTRKIESRDSVLLVAKMFGKIQRVGIIGTKSGTEALEAEEPVGGC
jgi:hypothetical protein